MSVTPSSYVVGIFTDRSIADQTIEALYHAGFGQESIRYSAPAPASGGFFGDLKSIFTGANSNVDNLASDLSDMGLSAEDVQYYTHEYNNGHTIVAVNAPGREREAASILHQYGAYGTDAKSDSVQDTTNPVQQTPSNAQPESYSAYDQQHNAQDRETEPQLAEERPLDSYQHDSTIPAPDTHLEDQSTQPAVSTYASEPGNEQAVATTPETETTDQTPLATEEDNPQASMTTPEQASQSDVVSPEHETGNYATQPDMVVIADDENVHEEVEPQPETTSDDTDEDDVENKGVEQEPERESHDVGATDNTAEDPTTEPVRAVYTPETYTHQDSAVVPPATHDETPSEQEVADQTMDTPEHEPADQTDLSSDQSTAHHPAVEAPAYNYGADNQEVQTNTFTPEPEAEVFTTPSGKLAPQYTNKLLMMQQQLQATQQRLQEVKAQLQEAKDHEVQLQQTRDQLQAIQAEFEKTLAELDEIHARIEQY